MRGHVRKTSRLEQERASAWANRIIWFGLGLLTALAIAAIAVNWWESSPHRTEQPARFYTELPGIDLASVAEDHRPALLEQANRERCTCGCKMTLAYCRNHDRSCRTSVRLCLEMVQRFREPRKADDK